jgi:hypothetical protein
MADAITAKAPEVIAPPPPGELAAKAQIAYMWVGPTLSFLVLAGFFFMLWSLLHVDAEALGKLGNIQNVLFTLLGALGAAFTQVINYWLGSSKGSADKTSLLKGGE